MREICPFLALIGAAAIASGASAAPKTSVRFVDGCGRPTNIAVPEALREEEYDYGYSRPRSLTYDTDTRVKEARLQLSIDGLEPGAEIKVHLRTANMSSSDPNLAEVDEGDKTLHADDSGCVDRTFSVHFKMRDKRYWSEETLRHWASSVTWRQGADRPFDTGIIGGGGAATIYVLGSRSEPFFRHQGGPLCRWLGPIAISSDYRFNESHQSMLIEREYTGESLDGVDHGVSAGFSQDDVVGNGRPLSGGGRPLLFAWFFPEWNAYSLNTQRDTVRRQWHLDQEQGGYFGRRLRFSRFKVEQFLPVEVENGACLDYVPAGQGQLDVGAVAEDFYIVPHDFSGSADASLAFMQKAAAPLGASCPSDSALDADPQYLISSGALTSLYFYPEGAMKP